ncbi:hypothetical protein [Nocardioides lacusdianchii]|nr:hypothetical protein [Nocardioides lacusdianchii]
MGNDPHDTGAERADDEPTRDDEPVGVEIGMDSEDGSTFEPEEDPEDNAG